MSIEKIKGDSEFINPEKEQSPEKEGRTLYDIATYRRAVEKIIAKASRKEKKEFDEVKEKVFEHLREGSQGMVKGKEAEFEALIEDLEAREYADEQELIDVVAEEVHAFVTNNFSLAELENNAFERRVESKDGKVLNRLFYYNYDPEDKELDIHVIPGATLPFGQKLKLIRDAFAKLAEELENNPELEDIETIAGTSWILKKNIGLAKRFGFTVDAAWGKRTDEKRVYMSREDFLKLYGNK